MHTYLCHDWGWLGEGYGDLPVPWFVTSWESITTSKIREFLKSKGITHTHTHTHAKFQGFSNFSPSERMGVGYPDRSRAEIEILFYLKHGNPSFLYNNCLHLIFGKKISSKYLGNTDTLGRHTAHMLRFHIPSGMLTLTRFEKHKHKRLTRIVCS